MTTDAVVPVPGPEALTPTLRTDLPPLVAQKLASFNPTQIATFGQLYGQQEKQVGTMVALSILFPIQLLLLKKVGLWFAFFFTGGGFFIWYVVEWFMTPGRVRAYNAQVAMEIAVQISAMT